MKAGINEGQTPKVGQNRNTGAGLKLFSMKKRTDTGKLTEEAELIKAITDARSEWLDSVANFEHVYEENLIDYYTYKMKACEARYAYFIKKAREMGLKAHLQQGEDTTAVYNR